MNLIATVDKNWAIGKQGHLLVNIPEDIKLFRMETAGKAAIMGRKTYEQITDRTALIDRYNVVLTSDLSYKKDGVVVVHSVEEALEKVASYKSEDIYVIGGESVFEQFLPYCDVAHITSVDYKYESTVKCKLCFESCRNGYDRKVSDIFSSLKIYILFDTIIKKQERGEMLCFAQNADIMQGQQNFVQSVEIL